MASLSHSDFVSLAEEKFDFDISLSPASSKGDYDVEDEVFVGPVGHKEKCISHGVETHVKESVSSGQSLGEEPSWSPLTGENFDEICKEAHLLASHLEQTITDSVAESSAVSLGQAEATEAFEEDTTVKLSMFSKPTHVLSPIKRETFFVQESPMKQLPPAIQKRMLKEKAGFGKSRLSTSSPVRPAVTQPKIANRGKVLVASSGLLPSKPTAQGNSRLSSTTKLPTATKTRLPPPSKGNFRLKRSPSRRNTSKAGSFEDLLSDTASVASDVSDSSFNASFPGRSCIPGQKKTELRAPFGLKAPLLQNSRVVDKRRNTSSSSSSVSSINSSLSSISPGSKAKLNSSLNSSTNSIGARSHSTVNRLQSSSRKSSVVTRNPEPPVSRRTSISAQEKRAFQLLPRPVKATPIKRTDSFPPPQFQTPAKTTAEKTTTSSIPASNNKIGCAQRGNTKLKVPVVPTPINYLKGVRKSEVSSSPDFPRIMKPKKLLSACSMESIPDNLVGPPVSFLTPPGMGNKLRRPSALPTPVNRRVSGIPTFTPKSVSRLSRSFQITERSSNSSQGATNPSSENMKETEKQEDKKISVSNEVTCPPAGLQSCSLVFNLEDETEGPPACEPTTVENPSESSSLEPAAVENPSEPSSCDPEPPQVDMKPPTLPNTLDTQKPHLPKNKENRDVKEVLLVDAPVPALQMSEKLLIDLSNTPDLIKTSSAKPWGEQLIDLSSPLIKWSPEDKRENTENTAPLIDLSF